MISLYDVSFSLPGAGRANELWSALAVARMGFIVSLASDRAFDAAGMDTETERRMRHLRQGSRLQRSPRVLVLLDELPNLVGGLVGLLRPAGARQQAGNALAFKRGIGLIVGWPRQAEKRGGIGLVDAILEAPAAPRMKRVRDLELYMRSSVRTNCSPGLERTLRRRAS